jgi:hypothetical protein
MRHVPQSSSKVMVPRGTLRKRTAKRYKTLLSLQRASQARLPRNRKGGPWQPGLLDPGPRKRNPLLCLRLCPRKWKMQSLFPPPVGTSPLPANLRNRSSETRHPLLRPSLHLEKRRLQSSFSQEARETLTMLRVPSAGRETTGNGCYCVTARGVLGQPTSTAWCPP